MVVGLFAALSEDRTYTYSDLRLLFDVGEDRFDDLLYSLVERRKIRPVLAGDILLGKKPRSAICESDLQWRIMPREHDR